MNIGLFRSRKLTFSEESKKLTIVISIIGTIIKADNTRITGLANSMLEIFFCNTAKISVRNPLIIRLRVVMMPLRLWSTQRFASTSILFKKR